MKITNLGAKIWKTRQNETDYRIGKKSGKKTLEITFWMDEGGRGSKQRGGKKRTLGFIDREPARKAGTKFTYFGYRGRIPRGGGCAAVGGT